MLVSILENDGYKVLAVEEGAGAVVAAASFKPDLALLDAGLPGIGGADVACRLRQSSDLPIMFVTAADSAAAIHDAFKLGADDYIVKPFDPGELSWRVRAVLRRSGHAVAHAWECGDLVVDEGAAPSRGLARPYARNASKLLVRCTEETTPDLAARAESER